MPSVTTDRKLEGKRAVITGASRGLGAAIAEAMWQAGAAVLLVARSEAGLLQVRDRLLARRAGAESAHVLTADLRDATAPKSIIAEARRIWPRLDILVNNAGIIGPMGMVADNDWEQWRDAIQVNLLAPGELCKLSIGWMRETGGGGSIINLSGGGATGPRPRFSAYATAKCALVRFSETIAAEVANLGIRVNCIAPGAMHTAMLQEILKAGPEQAGAEEYERVRRVAVNEASGPPPAAGAAVYLASERAAGLTGKLISAVWDPWSCLHEHFDDLRATDIYTLRRIVPEDRGKAWANA